MMAGSRSRPYDHEAVERVRRTLSAVAEATRAGEEAPPPPTYDAVPRLGGATHRGGVHGGRARWWVGAASVGVAGAALVAFVAVTGPDDPPGLAIDAGDGDTTDPDEAMTFGVEDIEPVSDVAVPGVVPDGYEYQSLDVLAALKGSIEVNVFDDDGSLQVAFATDEPEAAQRLSERLDLWGDDLYVTAPTLRRDDGYLIVTRDALDASIAEDEAAETVAALAAGRDAAEAAPDGYELAASVTTAQLPEAGRLVRVDYADGDRALRLETRQGTLSPELASHLYPAAEPAEIRGRPGFRADAAYPHDSLLIWQEAPGLVVSVSAADLDPPTLDQFVQMITVVPEDSWVTLREKAAEPGDPSVVETPPRPIAEGDLAGMPFRLKVSERGSLADGVTACRHLGLDGDQPDDPVCVDARSMVTSRRGDLVIVWMVAPVGVVDVRADVPMAGPPALARDPARPDGSLHVLMAFPVGPNASIQLLDGSGAVVRTEVVPLT